MMTNIVSQNEYLYSYINIKVAWLGVKIMCNVVEFLYIQKYEHHFLFSFYEDYFNEEGDDLNKFKMKQHFMRSLLFF